MAMNKLHKVFVYGTLKQGEPNHHWFSKSANGHYKFLFHAKTKESFPLIIGTRYNIPFLLNFPGKGFNVQGEVYEVDDKVFGDLDVLEDHPNFYIREEHDVTNIDESVSNPDDHLVWIYMIKNFKKELLENKQFFENYSNEGSHGLKYVSRYLREENEDFKNCILN